MARTISRTETGVGYSILIILLVIAAVIFLKQSDYNPAVLQPEALQTGSPVAPSPAPGPSPDPSRYAPQQLTPLSAAESFGPENLSEKINGKAELYLSAGFVRLVSQRFAAKQDADVWMEIFIYDMGTAKGSFSVYSLQKRFDGEDLGLSRFAYKTKNALFFVHGSHYVEMVGSVDHEWMAELMLSFAKNFIRDTGTRDEKISELAFFPVEGLDKDSISLLPADAFGFEKFDSVFTARYLVAGGEATAFFSQRKSAAEALQLAEAYFQFLLANGGKEEKLTPNIPGARLMEIMETYELMFPHGSILAGVHGAENRTAAERLALMLKESIAEAGR